VQPVTEAQLRSCFINCSKGEAKRMAVPRDLGQQPWEDLDFLGWSDPAGSGRAWLAWPAGTGTAIAPTGGKAGLIGVAFRHEPNASTKTQLCSLCLTAHSRGGVSLMAAAKAGDSGRRGNTIGTYLCTDLACSLYLRDKKKPALGLIVPESLTIEQKVTRLVNNLATFVDRLQD